MVTSFLNRFAPINFDGYIDRLTDRFAGREWLFEQHIDPWLQQQGKGQFYLLTGEPGVGKSAIVAQLVKRWKAQPQDAEQGKLAGILAAYHFCRAGDVETVRPGRVLRSIAAQLGQTLPYYSKALNKVLEQVHLNIDVNINIDRLTNSQVTGIYIENLKDLDPREELRLLIQAPLAELPTIYQDLSEEERKKLPTLKVFLIDSLDEAVTTTGRDNVATLLAALSQTNDLPPWIRFILTARPDLRAVQEFSSVKRYKLEELFAKNLEDIEKYVGDRVQELITSPESEFQTRLEQAEHSIGTLVDKVKTLSEGNFLYTRLVMDGISIGELSLKNLSALPKNLYEVYQRFLRHRCPVRKWVHLYQPILGTLTVTQEAISTAQLTKFARIASEQIEGEAQVESAIGILRQFLDEVEDGQGQKLYTIFHQSLREYLLDRKRNHDFWCDAKEQHDNIIKCCEQESQNWQDLREIDLYGLRHLAQHLVKGDQIQELHTLLSRERNNRNAWFDVKDISSYQADVRLAWEQTTKEILSAKTIALLFRYTLITTSLNSLITQIPIELLVAAVQHGQWSPEKAISFALQIPDPQQKVAALTQLPTFLPPALKTQSLQTAIKMLSSLGDETDRTEAFTKLIPELPPELLSQTLDFALSIKDRDSFKTALTALAPRLDDELLSKALRIFFTTEPYRIGLLTAITPHLDRANLWLVAFESIPFVNDNKTRADALLELTRELPSHPVEATWWKEIFNAILSVLDGDSRSKALAFLAPILPVDYLESSLEIALTTWYLKKYQYNFAIEYDSQALQAIAPYLSQELLSKTIDIQLFYDLKNNYFKDDYSDYFKVKVASDKVASDFYKEIHEKHPDLPPDLLEALSNNLSQNTYCQVISILARYLCRNLLSQVFKTLSSNYFRNKELVAALTSLVPYFPEALEPAYNSALNIIDSSSRVIALMNLVPHLPNTTLQTLEASFKKIENPFLRHLALNTLVPYLPEAYFHTLQAAKQIENEIMRSAAVESMEASHISPKCLSLILELAFSLNKSDQWINIQSKRAEILIHFLPHQPELFPFAWDAVLSIDGGRSFSGDVSDEDIRVKTTREFVSAIPEQLISQALDKAIGIYNEPLDTKSANLNRGQGSQEDFEQAFMLEMLAPRITPDLLPKAIKAARAIIKFERRDPVLSALACALPEYFPLDFNIIEIRENSHISDEDKSKWESRLRAGEDNRELIYRVAKAFELQTDYLKAMTALAPYFPEVSGCFCNWRIIGGEDGIIAPLLQSIAHHLDEKYLVNAVKTASNIKNTEDRIETLLKIANYLSPNSRDKILDVFQSINLERNRSKALIQLIPLLPENENLFKKIFDDAMSMTDDNYRLPILVALIPYISKALPRALEVISSVKDYYEHSQSLLALSKYLPEASSSKLLENSLSIAKTIPSQSSARVSALSELAPFSDDAAEKALDAAISYETFRVCFSNHLKSIAPYLANNKEALVKAFEAAKSLGPFGGYKYEALMALAPYLPEALCETKDAIYGNSYRGTSEASYLVKLAPHLLDIIPDAFKAILSCSNSPDFDFIEHLEELMPLINAKHMLEALNLTKSLSVWSRPFAFKILLHNLSLTHPKVFRKLAKKYTSKSISFPMTIFQTRSWIMFLEKMRIWQKGDSEIFLKAQEIQESLKGDNQEITWFYVYSLTELNPNLESSLIESAIEKPLLWDFTRDVIDDFIKGIAPHLSQELIGKLLEEDPTISEQQKAVSADYAIRLRRHASVFLAPYLPPNLFEKALEVSIVIDDSDRAKILKALIPKLAENQLPRAKQILESIKSSKEHTELLFIYAVRCPHMLIEVLQAVFSLHPEYGRTERLKDIHPYLQQIPTTNLFSFWTKSLESLLLYQRAELFKKMDVLAPVAQQLGGDEAIESLADSIDCVTRWWR
jgi:hypothetical protein